MYSIGVREVLYFKIRGFMSIFYGFTDLVFLCWGGNSLYSAHVVAELNFFVIKIFFIGLYISLFLSG